MQIENLKEELGSLVKLQHIDSEIYQLKREKEVKPAEIKLLESAFEEKKQGLKQLEKELLDLQKERKDQELELASKEEGVKKLQSQLFALKTNKEYSAMMQQIQDAKADGSLIEDRILEIMDSTEKKQVEIEKEKQHVQEEEKVFNAQKKSVDERVKVIDELLAQLEVKRKQLFPGINPKIIEQYERILHSRDGLAIACIKDNACGGCHMQVPPQVVNLIKMYERIITCEVCNRMLYIEE